jgi:hypothetical protein
MSSPLFLPQPDESSAGGESPTTPDETVFKLDNPFDLFEATMREALSRSIAYRDPGADNSDSDDDFTDIDDGEFAERLNLTYKSSNEHTCR